MMTKDFFVELSIIIPVYNEGKVVKENLSTVDLYLQGLGIIYEIILVNDGSTDNTLEQASLVYSDRIKIISYSVNRGKGFAVKQGLTAGRGRYRLFMDMDLSTDLSEIQRFYQYVRSSPCDICVGNRHSVSLFDQERPWHRALFGKIFAILSSLCTGCFLDDFTCGFKIFTAEACDKILPYQRVYDWAFDAELVAIAHQKGLRICQKPVAWEHKDGSKVRYCAAVVTSLKSLLKIMIRTIFGEVGRK